MDLNKLKKPGAAVVDLEQASLDRLADARTLLAAGKAAGTMAAAVYALEIYLKVLVCRKLELPTLHAVFEIHDLRGLLILAGLDSRMKAAPAMVQNRWDEVVTTFAKGLNDYRYSPESRWQLGDAGRLLQLLEDPNDGVLTWLRTQN